MVLLCGKQMLLRCRTVPRWHPHAHHVWSELQHSWRTTQGRHPCALLDGGAQRGPRCPSATKLHHVTVAPRGGPAWGEGRWVALATCWWP